MTHWSEHAPTFESGHGSLQCVKRRMVFSSNTMTASSPSLSLLSTAAMTSARLSEHPSAVMTTLIASDYPSLTHLTLALFIWLLTELFKFETGSSPHARGARHLLFLTRFRPGIIPACAGSTEEGRPRLRVLRDHPRTRGEHSRRSFITVSASGSSPHARGAPASGGRAHSLSNIIPARAGSTH